VRRVTSNEYSASCPFCPDGGNDRFKLFIVSNATGGAMGWCRQCDRKWFPDMRETQKLTPAEVAEIENRRKAIEEEERLSREKALADFTRSRIWEKYHNDLNDFARKQYDVRGIPEYFMWYWQLGYCRFRDYYTFTSASLTIPIQTPVTKRIVNIKHRLLNPHAEYRYLYETKGLPKPPFICNLDAPLAGKVLLIEGEFKAMTTYITLDDPTYNCVGLGSATPDLNTLSLLDNCDVVYLILDGDARKHEERITERLGSRCRIVHLPGKIDDLIMENKLDKRRIKMALGLAKRT
jgi:hypothetical protein